MEKLTKQELIELSNRLLEAQKMYYLQVMSKKLDSNSAFFQLAGYIQHTRKLYNLPALY
jgi:hypothetical protein